MVCINNNVSLVYLFFIFYYLMNFILFIDVNNYHNQILQHVHLKSSVHLPTLQSVSFGNCKFFKVCESKSALQRSSLCPFFRFHMQVIAFDVGVSLSD